MPKTLDKDNPSEAVRLDEVDCSTFDALIDGSKLNPGLPFEHEWSNVIVGWTAADKQTLFAKLKSETSINVQDLKRHLKQLTADKKNDNDKTSKPGQGRAIEFDDPKPWTRKVIGAKLLDEIADTIRAHVYTSDENVDAMVLWAAMTWLHADLQKSPFMFFHSATKRCGKTTGAEVQSEFVRRPQATASISESGVFRFAELYGPTFLFEEIDNSLRDKPDMVASLNASHSKKTAWAIRNVGDDHEPRTFSIWCPKIFIGIGQALSSATLDRSIVISLERKPVNVTLSRWRDRDRKMIERLQRQLVRWTNDIRPKLTASMSSVSFPPNLDDRGRDAWEPLLAIADLAGPNWSGRALRACSAITAKTRSGDQDSARELLIADLAKIFADEGCPTHLPTNYLLEKLITLEERPWIEWTRGKPMTPRGLANQLKHFGIVPCTIRLKTGTIKGYRLEQFKAVFATYVVHPPILSVTPSQPAENKAYSDSLSVTSSASVTDRKTPKPTASNDCDGVTDRITGGDDPFVLA